MDTSKEYIKMCEKADEIQRERPVAKLQDGDFIADWRFKKDEVIIYHPLIHDVGFGEEGPDDEFTWWLPRQDQLQKMVRLSDTYAMHRVGTFNYIIHRHDAHINKHTTFYQYYYGFASMEQLWLAFVMKEKYNKIWDGEEWRRKEK